MANRNQPQDYYAVLGVARDADELAIKSAYKKAARANHPDRNPGEPDAARRFREARKAYDILGDPQQRAAYDREYERYEVVGPSGTEIGIGVPEDLVRAARVRTRRASPEPHFREAAQQKASVEARMEHFWRADAKELRQGDVMFAVGYAQTHRVSAKAMTHRLLQIVDENPTLVGAIALKAMMDAAQRVDQTLLDKILDEHPERIPEVAWQSLTSQFVTDGDGNQSVVERMLKDWREALDEKVGRVQKQASPRHDTLADELML